MAGESVQRINECRAVRIITEREVEDMGKRTRLN